MRIKHIMRIKHFREYVKISTNDFELSELNAFCEAFNVDHLIKKIKLIKIEQGGHAQRPYTVAYSSKASLIHELLHLLQYEAEDDEKGQMLIMSYKNVSSFSTEDLRKEFVPYMLQRQELNNQAISVAYWVNSLKLDVKSLYKSITGKELEDQSTQSSRIRIMLGLLYDYRGMASRKKSFLKKKTMQYTTMMNTLSTNENVIKHGFTTGSVSYFI